MGRGSASCDQYWRSCGSYGRVRSTHRDQVRVLIVTACVNLYDIRMVEVPCCARFPEKPKPSMGRLAARVPQGSHRHPPPEQEAFRLTHLAHASRPQQGLYPVEANL